MILSGFLVAFVVLGIAVLFALVADLIENELRVWRRSRDWRPNRD